MMEYVLRCMWICRVDTYDLGIGRAVYISTYSLDSRMYMSNWGLTHTHSSSQNVGRLPDPVGAQQRRESPAMRLYGTILPLSARTISLPSLHLQDPLCTHRSPIKVGADPFGNHCVLVPIFANAFPKHTVLVAMLDPSPRGQPLVTTRSCPNSIIILPIPRS